MVKRAAASALLDLVQKSRSNQTLLVDSTEACGILFNSFLPACGDYATQVRYGSAALSVIKSQYQSALRTGIGNC